MNEEKLYVIKSKSDDKFYFSGDRVIPNWSDNLVRLFRNYEVAKEIAEDNNGQPVTLIEKPEKVVLTKEQAEIVERAHDKEFPATYISDNTDASNAEERLIIHACFNGYTAEKDDKRYLVELDGLVTTDGAKQYLTKKDGKWFASRRMSELHQDFTDEELNKAPEWAQQLNREDMTALREREEVADDEK